MSPSGVLQALALMLAVGSPHKAGEGTEEVPACPAPGEARLGKPQLWAEGTSCESIAGVGCRPGMDGQ